jgi:hypothetical protein
MIPGMSRPANPYDNLSCESFVKTLKREEIYANQYRDLEDLRAHIEEFIEKPQSPALALGVRLLSPEEFEQQIQHFDTTTQSHSAAVEFFSGVKQSATTPLTVFKHHFLSNWRNSTGAPFSTIKATVTPGEGELGAMSISFPAISAERSSTSKATCGTVRTRSGTGASGSKRIHSIP